MRNGLGFVLVTTAFSLASHVAFADDAKSKDAKPAADTKAAADEAKSADDSSGKKSEEVPAAAPPKDEALRTTGPAAIKRVDALSQKKFDNSKKAYAKRDEQIAEIKALLPKMRGKPQEGELVFRLAEIYWNRSKFVYESEFKDFDALCKVPGIDLEKLKQGRDAVAF